MTNASTNSNMVLDNLSYDLITMIHEKSKALEAYDQYERDAQGHPEISRLLAQIRQQDTQNIQQLIQHLSQLMSSQHHVESHALGDGTDTARLAST